MPVELGIQNVRLYVYVPLIVICSSTSNHLQPCWTLFASVVPSNSLSWTACNCSGSASLIRCTSFFSVRTPSGRIPSERLVCLFVAVRYIVRWRMISWQRAMHFGMKLALSTSPSYHNCCRGFSLNLNQNHDRSYETEGVHAFVLVANLNVFVVPSFQVRASFLVTSSPGSTEAVQHICMKQLVSCELSRRKMEKFCTIWYM
jgi:hypothetical protein